MRLLRPLRTRNIALSAIFLAIIPATTACGDSQDTSVDADTNEICMDEATGLRVDDSKCPPGGGGGGGYVWMYGTGHAPAVGHPVPKTYSTIKTGVIGRAPAGGGRPISSGG